VTDVGPKGASTHLAKLTEAGVLSVIRDGRHRYFRLASPTVAGMIDGIVAVALEKRPRYRRSVRPVCATTTWRAASASISPIRSSVATTSCSTTKSLRSRPAGGRFLTEFGVELPARRPTRRHFCRLCLDWTERRPHIAGAVGVAITKRCFDLGWIERMKRSHAVIVTPLGRDGLPSLEQAGRRFDHGRSAHRPVRPFRM
jgi:hypothetical protein